MGPGSRDEQAYRALYHKTVEGWALHIVSKGVEGHEEVKRFWSFLRGEARRHNAASAAIKQFGDVIKARQGRLPKTLLACRREDLNPAGYLATPSGVLNLRDARLIPPKEARKLFVTGTRALPDEYNPGARGKNPDVEKLWGQFREKSKEEFEFLLDSFGFALRGKPSRRIVAIQGETGAGKTTQLRAIQAAIGPACRSFKGETLTVAKYKGNNEHRDDLAVFAGLIAYTVDSLKQGAALDKEQAKGLSGGDELTYRPINKAPITVEATATMFLAGNYPPRFGLDDRAIAARLVSVGVPEFDGPEDNEILDRIKASKEARQDLAAELVARAAKFTDGRPPEPPESSKERVKGWRQDELSELQTWLENNIEADPDGVIFLGESGDGPDTLGNINEEVEKPRGRDSFTRGYVLKQIQKIFPGVQAKKDCRNSQGRWWEISGVCLK